MGYRRGFRIQKAKIVSETPVSSPQDRYRGGFFMNTKYHTIVIHEQGFTKNFNIILIFVIRYAESGIRSVVVSN